MLPTLVVSLLAAAPSGSARCAGCHSEVYEQWRASRHASAYDNPSFARAFARSGQGWCLGCHAPRPEQWRARFGPGPPSPEDTLLLGDGVDCLACHAQGEMLLSASEPSPAARAAHAIRLAPELVGVAACMRCHDFKLPAAGILLGPVLPPWTTLPASDTWGQLTGQEWHRTGAPACQTCHMRSGAHAWPGARDADWVRAHVRAEARWLAPTMPGGGDARVEVTLTTHGIGHAFPTGDPYRRLAVWLCADAACTPPLAAKTLHRIPYQQGGAWRVEDSRVPAGNGEARAERRVQFVISDRQRRPTHWQIHYRLVDARDQAVLPPTEVGYMLAHGVIDPGDPRASREVSR